MNDTTQDRAARLVEREVYYCVSSLMSSVLAHPEAAAELFDCDAEDLYDLAYVNDYEGPAAAFIQNADEDDLRELCGLCDTAIDAGLEVPEQPDVYSTWLFGDEPHYSFAGARCVYETELDAEDGALDHHNRRLEYVRRELLDTTPAGDKAICEHFAIDPDATEVYEHWIVSRWLASRLEERGECVGEFAGMTIWGRTTTGQSISMDYVIQKIAEEAMK